VPNGCILRANDVQLRFVVEAYLVEVFFMPRYKALALSASSWQLEMGSAMYFDWIVGQQFHRVEMQGKEQNWHVHCSTITCTRWNECGLRDDDDVPRRVRRSYRGSNFDHSQIENIL